MHRKQMSVAVPSTTNFGGHLRSPTPDTTNMLMINPSKKPIFYVHTKPPSTSLSSRMNAHIMMQK
jgi:hypothetical protein